jgi:fructose-1,6-bisphosphatase I
MMEEQHRCGGSGVLTSLLTDISVICKMISHEVNCGALLGNLGMEETKNIHGEKQKKLDVLSNKIFMHIVTKSKNYAALASEELENIHVINDSVSQYLLLFDPLDGSSNIDINNAVGSIFSILRLPNDTNCSTLVAFLQPGINQVAAGYAIYGSSTMLVLTTGNGVNGFTLDQNIGIFGLTHPNMQISKDANEFAINASRSRFWEPPIKRYIDEALSGIDGPRSKDFNMRWVASMVAEVHRILCRSGIFMYPVDTKNIYHGGKLRLMYEVNPMAFIVEQAGGLAITGYERILDLKPKSLHQRIGVILGSKNEVEILYRYHKEYDRMHN